MEAIKWMLEREDRRWTFLVVGRHYLAIDHGSGKGVQSYRVTGEECRSPDEAQMIVLARTENLDVAGYTLFKQPSTRTFSEPEVNAVTRYCDIGVVTGLSETLRRAFLGKWVPV